MAVMLPRLEGYPPMSVLQTRILGLGYPTETFGFREIMTDVYGIPEGTSFNQHAIRSIYPAAHRAVKTMFDKKLLQHVADQHPYTRLTLTRWGREVYRAYAGWLPEATNA